MAKGDFTPVRLLEIQALLDSKWKEPVYSKDYMPQGETVKAVMENQTASFKELENPDKEREVAVKWADWCDDTARTTSNVDSCTIDGDEADPKTKTYALNTFIEDSFKIKEVDFQTSVLDQNKTIADGLAAKERNIYELFNTKILAVIDANKGVNPYLKPGMTTDADGNTAIPEAQMTIRKFYPYLVQVLKILKSRNVYMIDGSNFAELATLATVDNLNSDGKSDLALFKMIKYYNDLLGMINAGITDTTYVIDNGAIALANRVIYSRTPQAYVGSGFTRYSIPFKLIPGYFLDVQMQDNCVDGSIEWVWNLKLRAGIFVNPLRCNLNNTGIQGFKMVPNV